MFIEKRLFHSNYNYQKEGIICSIAFIQHDSDMERNDDEIPKKVWNACKSPETKKYFFDLFYKSIEEDLISEYYIDVYDIPFNSIINQNLKTYYFLLSNMI